ncbi:MAG: gamma-glutamyl-gamma-aminobutyrate hydrolase family protein [Prevotellaceae bacterium]|jgi:putative glutamine amidotransferase|nr:gamma-glutamyl-gamma-aminobutyrate hydrolase family protein [Prevotellaceae bacterium]
MKNIIFASQRVDINKDYQERRDALDQRWSELFWQMQYLLVPIPNHSKMVEDMLKYNQPAGIILTGGNNPVIYGGEAPERDNVDTLLIQYAVQNKIPLMGVCRGMQSIVMYFGGTLKKVNGHIAIKHKITGKNIREVNSFHAWAPDIVPNVFETLACSYDGEVEYIRHKILPVIAIMWHPERVEPFSPDDIELIENFFVKK